MADYSTVNCGCNNPKFANTFLSDVCNVLDGRGIGMFITACGVTVDCITDQTELETLIAANEATVLFGLVEKGDATPNVVDAIYACGPTEHLIDYTNTLDFTLPFSIENWDFMNEIAATGVLGELYWFVKSGVIFKAQGTPSVTANIGVVNDQLVFTGTATYDATELDKPYPALGPIFGCSNL